MLSRLLLRGIAVPNPNLLRARGSPLCARGKCPGQWGHRGVAPGPAKVGGGGGAAWKGGRLRGGAWPRGRGGMAGAVAYADPVRWPLCCVAEGPAPGHRSIAAHHLAALQHGDLVARNPVHITPQMSIATP